MPKPLSSIFTAPAKPRKRARTLPRIALALATLASAGLFNAAHATFPGENGVIVFDSPSSNGKVIKRVSPGKSAITTLADGNSPSASPDGQKIAFVKDSNIYVMNIDGANVIQLTNDQVSQSPAWLPDGSKLAYARWLGMNQPATLWTMKPDGTDKTFMRNLTSSSGGIIDLAWSPSGNIYTFNWAGLYIADDLNPGIRQLASDGAGSSWAPDGASILFNATDRNTDLPRNQSEINPDGSNRRSVPPLGATNGSSAISPDGKLIAGGVYTNNLRQLATRARAGTPTNFSWTIDADKTSWSRVPKNCYETTSQGGGGVLAGDTNFYATECAIAVMPASLEQQFDAAQVIAIGPDQRLYHRTYRREWFGIPFWTQFALVPGVGGNPNGIKVKKIAIAAAKDGSAQVVIINADDNAVYHAMRYSGGIYFPGTWSGFNQLDGAGGAPNFQARDVAITINGSTPTSSGNAQVIANGLLAASLYHRVRLPAGNWSPFAQVPGAAGLNTHELAIAASEDGNTNVLVTTTAADGSQGQIRHVLRDINSNWSAWGTLYIPSGTTISASSDVALTRSLSGKAQLMFTDSSGNALYQERPTPNVPSSWQKEAHSPQIIKSVSRTVSISAGLNPDNLNTRLMLTSAFPQ